MNKETTITVKEPPMADPETTPELMNDAQRAVFARAERRRILLANGLPDDTEPEPVDGPKKNDAAADKKS